MDSTIITEKIIKIICIIRVDEDVVLVSAGFVCLLFFIFFFAIFFSRI